MISLVHMAFRLGASRDWQRGLELALLTPALALLSGGAIVWCAHFSLSQRLQGIADLAAASVAADGGEEAEQAARKVVMREVVRAGLSRKAVAVFVERRERRAVLRLAYDAHRPVCISRFLPAPPNVIVRTSPLLRGG